MNFLFEMLLLQRRGLVKGIDRPYRQTAMADVLGAADFEVTMLRSNGSKAGDGMESPASRSANSMEELSPGLDSDADTAATSNKPPLLLLHQATSVNPNPNSYISSQFYTFNGASHHLMVACILQNRYATADEIRTVTPSTVLASWKCVWKDRNEDTAFLTGWKRIQDKLHARIDDIHGQEILYFKNNPQQSVPHIDQWHRIVQSFHGSTDLKHLGLKETIERIKQVWTVGAKFYGIPEAFIKVSVANCLLCSSSSDAAVALGLRRTKRRKFEYTESFEVHAKEVPQCLQQLAVKHQVVLCIRQKYVRYKPFLAEVKDYCCHRAGAPNAKKPGYFKRKRYTSKRCGCGFRIRAIVPITNYSEKEKTFVYKEEGKAIFKLYAVHSGHEPGPCDGNARVIHRIVGPASLAMDSTSFFDVEEGETTQLEEKDERETREAVVRYVHELQSELDSLEKKLPSFSYDTLTNICQDLAAVIQRLRRVDEMPKQTGLFATKEDGDDGLLLDQSFEDWREHHNRDKSEDAILDQTVGAFSSGLVPDSEWQAQEPRSSSKEEEVVQDKEEWLDPVKESFSPCHDKSILAHQDSGSCEQDGAVNLEGDGSFVTMHGDSYQESAKWYEGMTCSLDPTTECVNGLQYSVQAGFRHAVA